MLMKIGDVTDKYGISHRSLHYWESVGILQSSRAENDYRYYDEENQRKIWQIVLLRKLRLSIPSIQEIYQSEDLSKVAAVFTTHLDETKKEKSSSTPWARCCGNSSICCGTDRILTAYIAIFRQITVQKRKS